MRDREDTKEIVTKIGPVMTEASAVETGVIGIGMIEGEEGGVQNGAIRETERTGTVMAVALEGEKRRIKRRGIVAGTEGRGNKGMEDISKTRIEGEEMGEGIDRF